MTATKYKTVLKGKLNNTYLIQTLKVNLLYCRPFRFAYTHSGWMAYTKYDHCTANLPHDLDSAFEASVRQTLDTAHKQIEAQTKGDPKLGKKLGAEADRWALAIFGAYKHGIYSPLQWDASMVAKSADLSKCHAFPVKDYSGAQA